MRHMSKWSTFVNAMLRNNGFKVESILCPNQRLWSLWYFRGIWYTSCNFKESLKVWGSPFAQEGQVRLHSSQMQSSAVNTCPGLMKNIPMWPHILEHLVPSSMAVWGGYVAVGIWRLAGGNTPLKEHWEAYPCQCSLCYRCVCFREYISKPFPARGCYASHIVMYTPSATRSQSQLSSLTCFLSWYFISATKNVTNITHERNTLSKHPNCLFSQFLFL